MDRRLRETHGVSLREYEVLLALHDAPRRRLRRVDLAARILLTQSGVTRMLEKLEQDGLVAKAAGEEDRRVSYAVLTERGRRRFAAAARTHRSDIDALFTAHLTREDLGVLDRVLAKLPGGEGEGAWRERRTTPVSRRAVPFAHDALGHAPERDQRLDRAALGPRRAGQGGRQVGPQRHSGRAGEGPDQRHAARPRGAPVSHRRRHRHLDERALARRHRAATAMRRAG
jgi:DNA-binding MarR family transcriptional regulator